MHLFCRSFSSATPKLIYELSISYPFGRYLATNMLGFGAMNTVLWSISTPKLDNIFVGIALAVNAGFLMNLYQIYEIKPKLIYKAWVNNETLTVLVQNQEKSFKISDIKKYALPPVPNDFRFFQRITVNNQDFYISSAAHFHDIESAKECFGIKF